MTSFSSILCRTLGAGWFGGSFCLVMRSGRWL